MSIPRIIHHVYAGSEVPDDMAATMRTVTDMNPDWSYMFWNADTIPLLGVTYDYLLERYKKPVHVSDVVRLLAVQKYGGVYVDCDVLAVKPMDPLCQYDAVAAFHDGSGQICPAVFGAEPDHPWINWQVEHAAEYSAPDTPWNVALMTAAPRDGLTLVPTAWFYPWLWDTPKEDRKNHPDTMLVHLWKGSWAPWVIRDRT